MRKRLRHATKEDIHSADTIPRTDSANNTVENTHSWSNHGTPPSTPRWVKVFGIIFSVLVLLFVIMNLTGNNPFGRIPTSSVKEKGVNQP